MNIGFPKPKADPTAQACEALIALIELLLEERRNTVGIASWDVAAHAARRLKLARAALAR